MSTSFDPALEGFPAGWRSRRHASRHTLKGFSEDGFYCKNCGAFVSAASFLSGVQNRNHCPYCLWSRHLDLYTAGDRLSACKSAMRPVGLTTKVVHKKFGRLRGELMLIHICVECGGVSINRIAADDNPQNVFSVFEAADRMDDGLKNRLSMEGIRLLDVTERETVQAQLFGRLPDLAGEALSINFLLGDGMSLE